MTVSVGGAQGFCWTSYNAQDSPLPQAKCQWGEARDTLIWEQEVAGRRG